MSVEGEVECSWQKCIGALEGVAAARKCGSHQGGVKGMRKVCQLVGRCDGHWGDERRLLGGVTVVRKCGSHRIGVKGIRKVCQLVERCYGHVGNAKVLGEV